MLKSIFIMIAVCLGGSVLIALLLWGLHVSDDAKSIIAVVMGLPLGALAAMIAVTVTDP